MKELEPEAAAALPQMSDHWWWRPGWGVGRRIYMWYVTFEHDDAVRDLARAYEHRLDLPTLDVIPPRWLHLTALGVGFVDEVQQADALRMAEAARRRLAHRGAITARIGPAVVDPEVVSLQVTPAGPVDELRRDLQAATADVRGALRGPEPDEGFFSGSGYVPHVSLAYSNGDADMRSILDVIRREEPPPVRTTISGVGLVAVHRDRRMYEWTAVAHVEFGSTGDVVS